MLKKVFLLLLMSQSFFLCCHDATSIKPKVSIITSIYNGDDFIESFLADIVIQTIFDQCELILINANSPGNEEGVIQKYMQRYSNIRSIRLNYDPGIYGVWNLGIMLARADFITNANLDDRRNPRCLEVQAHALEENSEVDLVYGDYYITYKPNETFAQNTHRWVALADEFSLRAMNKCLPGPQPMWRKAMHHKYGFFDESFLSSGDMEMWLRAASRGSLFKHIPLVTGLYYVNPDGLSTTADSAKMQKRDQENAFIVKTYQHVWQ